MGGGDRESEAAGATGTGGKCCPVGNLGTPMCASAHCDNSGTMDGRRPAPSSFAPQCSLRACRQPFQTALPAGGAGPLGADGIAA